MSFLDFLCFYVRALETKIVVVDENAILVSRVAAQASAILEAHSSSAHSF